MTEFMAEIPMALHQSLPRRKASQGLGQLYAHDAQAAQTHDAHLVPCAERELGHGRPGEVVWGCLGWLVSSVSSRIHGLKVSQDWLVVDLKTLWKMMDFVTLGWLFPIYGKIKKSQTTNQKMSTLRSEMSVIIPRSGDTGHWSWVIVSTETIWDSHADLEENLVHVFGSTLYSSHLVNHPWHQHKQFCGQVALPVHIYPHCYPHCINIHIRPL